MASPLDADHWPAERWAEDDYAAWTRSTCPAGRPQRLAPCLNYRELVPKGLQLTVVLSGDEGVCSVDVEEDEDRVRVRILVCYSVPRWQEGEDRVPVSSPIYVGLEEPLGDRTVVDMETHTSVPVFVPNW